jgi:hypothetical protein
MNIEMYLLTMIRLVNRNQSFTMVLALTKFSIQIPEKLKQIIYINDWQNIIVFDSKRTGGTYLWFNSVSFLLDHIDYAYCIYLYSIELLHSYKFCDRIYIYMWNQIYISTISIRERLNVISF